MVSFGVVAVDTTQATAADRVKIYMNGSQMVSANNGYSAENYPSQNDDLIVNNTVARNMVEIYILHHQVFGQEIWHTFILQTEQLMQHQLLEKRIQRQEFGFQKLIHQ